MTQAQIQLQIDAIDRVSKEVLKSKESALKFLEDSGILEMERYYASRIPNKRKKKK